MPRHTYPHAAPNLFGALTAEQAERVRTALRSAAGEYAGAEELGIEELEERIAPGLSSTN